MIKTLLFDNNGVLTDSDKECTTANFAKYFDIDESELVKVFDECAKPLDDGTISTVEFYQSLADIFGKEFDEKELREVHVNSYQPKPMMRKVVEELKKRHEIALLTNFGDAYDEANEQVWKYDNLFDADKVFVSAKLKMKKPNHDIYQYALEKLGRNPEEVVFIDDRESNLVPARELGMKTILFENPEQFELNLNELLAND